MVVKAGMCAARGDYNDSRDYCGGDYSDGDNGGSGGDDGDYDADGGSNDVNAHDNAVLLVLNAKFFSFSINSWFLWHEM
jgi:hypothetical protein